MEDESSFITLLNERDDADPDAHQRKSEPLLDVDFQLRQDETASVSQDA